jgi:hypothetical protein
MFTLLIAGNALVTVKMKALAIDVSPASARLSIVTFWLSVIGLLPGNA